jgi:hypothetical protein
VRRGRPPGYGRLAPVTSEIHELRRMGLTLQEIGDRFGVTREAVRVVCLGIKAPPSAAKYRRFFRAVAVAARHEARTLNGGTLSLHGTRGRYCWGCRCLECTRANCVGVAALFGKPPKRHGTVSAYRIYGCRCVRCREAGSYDNRLQRLKRRTSKRIASGDLA